MALIIWDVTSCCLVGVYQCSGGMYCLYLHGLRVNQISQASKLACLVDLFITLKMEAVHSSETLYFYQITFCHIPTDKIYVHYNFVF
jgi:poly(3-hydroxyalkanoate) synthetase